MYGAAVFDANGHVVGIVTGGHGSFTDVMSSSDALPFIRKYVRNVLSNGISCDASSVEILGVSVVSVSDDESEKFGLPGGLLVVKCDGESTGENAGLMVNDIIIGVNSFAVENADTLDSLLKDHNGQTVSLLVYRNERYINIGVNVDA
jgi:S1-C subfamily serine protease